ncbi:unnamed protein product [Vitrella brassicaformis CCMP3155]|uniref:Uncharacterized protein n=1 Tax=Vitrella brassicaformis (strain CCMP3155) TaxID=1169540 RepID=A0A0G4ET29_VITBC|nr:unnamed protein product [Vitrella brassicaformis CCMP3155]|eukprot:CEM00983.1 unnamed protein product [Vitrella brassicaformis CCMP3155]
MLFRRCCSGSSSRRAAAAPPSPSLPPSLPLSPPTQRSGIRCFATFRHNICTNDWIAFPGVERRKRPQQMRPEVGMDKSKIPQWSANCPFCKGNEGQLPAKLLTLRASDHDPTCAPKDDFELYVLPNKFPVVAPSNCIADESLQYPFAASIMSMECNELVDCLNTARARGKLLLEATGFHEVVVDHPSHNLPIGHTTPVYWEMLFKAFRDRGLLLTTSPLIQSLLCFKNVGMFGGASMVHPHSQIIGLPIVPNQQLKLTDTAREYFQTNGRCLFCDYIKLELKEEVRIVELDSQFIAVVPFAAHIPYQILLLPLRHNYQFLSIDDDTLRALGRILHRVFQRINRALGDVDYNLVLRTAHLHRTRNQVYNPSCYYHWHVEIFPRLDSWPVAGFEFGSGIMCNAHMPEDDAKKLIEAGCD